jgi:hypothetical protein
MRRAFFAAAIIAASGLSLATLGARADEADYSNPDIWLCRAGRQDACTQPQDATIVAADGKMTR